MRKTRRDLWEVFIDNPSFDVRFFLTLFGVLFVFLIIGAIVLNKTSLISGIENQISFINLLIQGITLILGIFAAYYALRQLVETRFTSLDEAAMQELINRRYLRAFSKWKEAFYIRQESGVFQNLCEVLLLIGDYETFDKFTRMTDDGSLDKKNILEETSDQIIIFYLKSIRHLLTKNQGEAEKYINEILKITQKHGQPDLGWNFRDLESSETFLNLRGECKKIAENLIMFLKKEMLAEQKAAFESGNFIEDPGVPTSATSTIE